MSDKTSSGPTEAQATSILVFGRFAAMFAEAATPFVIVRLLGMGDVGSFSGLMLIYTTLSVIFTAGFPAAVLYYLANRPPDQRAALVRRMTTTVLLVGVVVGALVWLIGVFGDDVLATFGRWFGDEGATPKTPDEAVALSHLRTFAIFAILDVPARVFPNLLVAEKRPRGAALFGVFRAVGMTAGTLVPAALGGDVDAIVWGLTIYSAVQTLYMAIVMRGLYHGVGKVPSEVSAGEMLRFSVPLGITEVVNNLNAATDRYLILLFSNATAFAQYRAGAWQLPLTAIPYSVGNVYLPKMVELLRAGDSRAVIDLWRQTTLKTALIVVPVAMVFLLAASDFVRFAFTDAYAAATPVFAIYMLVTMARVSSFGTVILAAGKSRYVLRAAAFTFAVTVLLSLPLTIALGFVGPALGTAMAFVPMIAVYCYFIAKSIDVPFTHTFPLRGWLELVALAALSGAPVLVLDQLVTLPRGMCFGLMALTLVPIFIVLARATGRMTADDLRFLAGFLKLDFLRKKK